MAWLDIIIGALIGTIIAMALSGLFTKHPRITVIIVICCALIGISLSDDFLTTNDTRWNLVDKIKDSFINK